MNPLHQQFVAEARELIELATEDLLALERGGPEGDRIDRVFRSFHTLKGAAGVVALPAMGLTMHAAEDLLAAIRGGRLALSAAVIDAALSALDQVGAWVSAFEASAALPAAAGEDARRMAEQLRALARATAATAAGPGEGAVAPLPGWLTRLLERDGEAIRRHQAEHDAALTAIAYLPRAECFFNGDDPIGLMQRLPDLLAFAVEPREPWPPPAELDPFACNLCLYAITAAEQAAVAEIFRLVPDQLSVIAVPRLAPALSPPGVASGGDGAAAPLARAILVEQAVVLRASDDASGLAGRLAAAARVATNVLRQAGRGDLVGSIDGAHASATKTAAAAPLIEAIEQALDALDHARAAPTPAALAPVTPPPSSTGVAAPTSRVPPRALRIDETKIDRVLALAGELAVTQSALAQLHRRIEHELADGSLATALRAESGTLARLTGDLRGAALQLRMVAVAQVFRAFPRLVRDMAQRLDKDIALVTQGETTESDKAIVEMLFEPLLHLVRNAVDHGIESRAERHAAGKAPQATVTLRASRAADRMRVAVIDDGRGIDPAAIRRKAAERRLLSDEALAALSDTEVLDLIFTSGFSTAADVSDISGRGVGMDVVRTALERVGGRVLLTSKPGVGTTVTLDLPANVAILRIMVVEAGGQAFGIPMDAVLETVRAAPAQISRIKHSDALVLRGRTVPVCALADVLRLGPRESPAAAGDRLLVITETKGKVAALAVDAIRDRFDAVLKPMQGLLAQAPGYAGTTMLDDGSVLLVLSLRELVA